MNEFLEINFPIDVSYKAIGGPNFSTNISSGSNGFELRTVKLDNPMYSYKVSYGLKSKRQIDNLYSLFLLAKGRGIGFRFRDWLDCTANKQLIGTGDGSKKTFQLQKTYKIKDLKYVRKIQKIVTNGLEIKTTRPAEKTVEIFLGDSRTPLDDSKFKVDVNTGIVTFDAASVPSSAQDIYANFAFDVPVRFDVDYLPIEIARNNMYLSEGILLKEVKL